MPDKARRATRSRSARYNGSRTGTPGSMTSAGQAIEQRRHAARWSACACEIDQHVDSRGTLSGRETGPRPAGPHPTCRQPVPRPPAPSGPRAYEAPPHRPARRRRKCNVKSRRSSRRASKAPRVPGPDGAPRAEPRAATLQSRYSACHVPRVRRPGRASQVGRPITGSQTRRRAGGTPSSPGDPVPPAARPSRSPATPRRSATAETGSGWRDPGNREGREGNRGEVEHDPCQGDRAQGARGNRRRGQSGAKRAKSIRHHAPLPRARSLQRPKVAAPQSAAAESQAPRSSTAQGSSSSTTRQVAASRWVWLPLLARHSASRRPSAAARVAGAGQPRNSDVDDTDARRHPSMREPAAPDRRAAAATPMPAISPT